MSRASIVIPGWKEADFCPRWPGLAVGTHPVFWPLGTLGPYLSGKTAGAWSRTRNASYCQGENPTAFVVLAFSPFDHKTQRSFRAGATSRFERSGGCLCMYGKNNF